MSKTSKIKLDLDDTASLIEIIQILKDVASNHFYNTAKRKEKLEEFAIEFTEFFRMVSLAEARSPLVHAETDATAIVAITSEGGFMAEMNAKVLRKALQEAEKLNFKEFIVIGSKGVEKMSVLTELPVKAIVNVEEKGLFSITLEAKNYIVEQVEKGALGRVLTVYPKAKAIDFIAPAVVRLLPSEELLTKQREIKDTVEKVIVESDLNEIIHYLAELWLTGRMYEMLEDCVIAGYAAQSQQLESSLEKLKKDKKGLMVGFRKAKKSDVDKSLREVFTSKMMRG
jgi:F0F1-type ATP synthase gamma subunit